MRESDRPERYNPGVRRIAVINQKGGVGKTTTSANLAAALAEAGRRVLLIDLDPQANLSMHLGVEIGPDVPSIYGVLVGEHEVGAAIRPVFENLALVPSLLDLSGAEMELAGAIGRETLLRDAIDRWAASTEASGEVWDYVLIDCPPSLGLLSVNGLTAADEAFIALQTEFFALQGMSKLVEIVQLLRRRLNPALRITGILPCLYDPRLRLAREVLAEIRRYFPSQVFKTTIRTNVKLAEAPSYGLTILQYAPESNGAADYRALAAEVLAQEAGYVAGNATAAGSAPTPETPVLEAAEPPEPAKASEAPQATPPADGPTEPVYAAQTAGDAPGDAPGDPDSDLEDPAEPPEPDPEPELATEYVLVPGKGLRPVERRVGPRPVALTRAHELPALPQEAFGAPSDSAARPESAPQNATGPRPGGDGHGGA